MKQWRNRRGFSQLDLALASNVSQRHISFLESGRANPSRDMVLLLASVLDVPLREQNVMLTAAGFAPLYTESDFSAPEIAPICKALEFMLRQQEPYPAIVVDRYWNFLQSNVAATRLLNYLVAPEVIQTEFYIEGKFNLMRFMFHPKGLRPFIPNWEEIAGHLIQRVHREAIAEGQSNQSTTLLNELLSYPDVPRSWQAPNWGAWHVPLLTVNFVKNNLHFSFFSTIATLGTPQDITLQELRIECLFPADEVTEQNLRKLSDNNV